MDHPPGGGSSAGERREPLLHFYNRLTSAGHRFATVTGKGFRPNTIDLGRGRVIGGLICLLLPALVALPTLAMAWASLLPYYRAPSVEAVSLVTLANYRTILADDAIIASTSNTIVIGAVSAVLVMVVTVAAAWLMARTRIPWRGLLDQVASIPLIIPGVVAGIAILRTYINFPIRIYGTIWILVAAYVMRYIPYGMRYAHAGILQLHADLEESAEMSGANLPRRFARIVIPLIMPAIAGGGIYVFLQSSSQLAVPLLLSSGRNEVIAVSIYNLWHNGQVTVLAAFSMVVTAAIVAVGYGFYRLSRRYGI